MDVIWDDLRTVMLLVRHGSLAVAADALGINYTTVARRIRRAEAALNQPLFERLPEGYRPTDAAHLIAEHAGQMEDAEHGLMRRLQGAGMAISGPLTITAPQLLIANFLSPMVDGFMTAYPDVDLRILATNQLLDLARREADLAIRISHNPGDTLKGRRLTRQDNASFASPDWARRLAADPETTVDWIVYDAYPNVPRGVLHSYPNHRVRLRLDDMVAMIGAARAGLGVVRTPMFLGRATQGLQQVPVLPPQPYADIWVVGHPDVWPSVKVRAFVDMLAASFKRHQDRFVS
jgi:DNA-binding transcriptional LysR family regulator